MGSNLENLEPWIPGKSNAEKMIYLASAYIESAQVLCEGFEKDEFTYQYTSVMVIRHLCRHALELYLKGCIAIKVDSSHNNHRLDELYETYKGLYPQSVYHFANIFPDQLFAREDFFLDELEHLQKMHDQSYRYPTDRAGNAFDQHTLFDIGKELNLIQNMRTGIHLLGFQIAEKFPKIYPPGGLY